MSSLQMAEEIEEYPLSHLLPKKETQVTDFLNKHPEFDGRGILIAILDTGVDPASPGLQVTSDGKPKIVDIMDCSGAGDVDTSTIRQSINGAIVGLSGRTLKIPESWNNPSNKFHIGLKPIFELFSKALKDRRLKERRERSWSPAHRLVTADAYRQLENHQQQYSTLDTLEQKWERDNLQGQVEVLKDCDKSGDDPGPVADCIVFNDGQNWRACVDTSFSGKLDQVPLMGSFRDTREYAKLTNDDLLTYSINVHDSGNLLEIVATSSYHGTHVAAITAANFPDSPEQNGCAPGAQFVSLGVNDNRLECMEQGTSLIRALNRCIELGVRIINYSYGEAANWQNEGRITKAIEEAVYKHDIIFVSSAGNTGPALSTNGCPGSTSTCCLGVGAYLSPQMMSALYSVREKLPPALFPWSARGPAPDGSLGICISAPGGAITSMPKWTLRGAMLMNGTSMSSPNAAGAIACLLSAFKSQAIVSTPFKVRLALENTAKSTQDDEHFAIGRGLLQLDSAYEYLCRHNNEIENSLVRYDISIDGDNRGIYLREVHEQTKPREINVYVEPIFHEQSSNEDKVSFCKHLVLCCNASWVKHPSHLELTNVQRQFNVRVDSSGLTRGNVHYTELEAFESDKLELGPLWRLPITVIVPETVTDTVHWTVKRKDLTFTPAHGHRMFVHVPQGTEWAVVKIQSHDSEKFCRFIIHAVQLLPQKSYRSHESFKMVNLSENGETTQSFGLVGGRTAEICIMKWWSCLGQSQVSLEISFHGLTLIDKSVNMLGCEIVKKVEVQNFLGTEDLNPAVNLRYICQPVKPCDVKLKPLGVRDLYQEGRQSYELVLNYNFNLQKSCECTCELPSLSDYLYESELDSQLWMVFTNNKQYVFAGEAFPSRYATKLEKGDYRLRIQLRHDDEGFLEKFRDLCVIVQQKLSSPIALDCYGKYPQAIKGGKKFQSGLLRSGTRTPIYVTGIPDEKLSKQATPGWYYTGVMTLPKDDQSRRVSQFPFNYLLTDIPAKKPAKTSSTPVNYAVKKQPEKTKQQEFLDNIRDVKINWLTKLPFTDAKILYEELLVDFSDHLPLHQTYLRQLVDMIGVKYRPDILHVVERVETLIDRDELLKFLGTKMDISNDETQTAAKNDKESRKQLLVEALAAKGSVLADVYLAQCTDSVPNGFRRGAPVKLKSPIKRGSRAKLQPPTPTTLTPKSSASDLEKIEAGEVKWQDESLLDRSQTESPALDDTEISQIDENVTIKDLDDIWIELMKWTEPNESKIIMFCAKHAVAHKHYGRALKLLQKASDEQNSKEIDILSAEICEQLGWIHVAENVRNWIMVKYPTSFRPF